MTELAHQMPANAVLVGFDGSTSSVAALAWAAKEAHSSHRGLHVLHSLMWPDDIITALEIDQAKDETTAAGMKQARAHSPGLEVTCQTSLGGVAASLMELSASASLIVIGARGHHLTRSVMVGATATQLAAHSLCPVVVVHDVSSPSPPQVDLVGRGASPRRVTVAVDGSESCAGAIEFAFERADRLGLGLTAIACWWWQEGGAYLAGTEDFGWDASIRDRELRLVSEQLAGWSQKYPDVNVQTLLVRGQPAECLIEESEGAELLVLGTRGRGGFTGLLLGSVSLRVLTGACRPVAVVPPTAPARVK